MLDTVSQLLLVALFMAMVNNRLVEGLIKPLFEKFGLDKFWLLYIAWATGGLLTWITGINLFQMFVPDALTGQILTALVCGGGANLISDLFGSLKNPLPALNPGAPAVAKIASDQAMTQAEAMEAEMLKRATRA